MRLKDKKTAPVGGIWYQYQDENGKTYRVDGFDTGWRGFESRVARNMRANKVKVPDNLGAYIEDQICSRQPEGKCFYEDKLGDNISKTIHKFAGAADKVAAVFGFAPKLKQKARGCSGCSRRRTKLNK